MVDAEPRSSRARICAWAALVAVLTVHGVMTCRLFPSWDALVDDERPVVVVDHAIHLYHGALGARFLTEHGTTWGYDPFFMAGYPETPVWDSSSNLSIAFQVGAGGRYSPRAYKLGLFACTLLIVAFLPAAALISGLGLGESTLAAALGLLVFWGCFPIALYRSGLFAFVSASAASALVLGLLWQFDRRPRRLAWVALAVSGVFLFFAHVTAPVMLAGGALAYLASVIRRGKARRKKLAAVVVAVILALSANAFWVIPLWKFRTIRSPAFSFLTADSAGYFWAYLWDDPVDGRVTLVLICLGLAGLLAWWFEGERLRAGLFGGSIAGLLTVTWVGSLWWVTKTLEPLRFRVTLDFLLALPAGAILSRILAGLKNFGGKGVRGEILSGLTAILVLGASWLASPRTAPALRDQLLKGRPLVVGLPPGAKRLVDWLKEETDLSARILFEDQLRLLERTDPESTHWTPLLPILLKPEGRMFLGGLYQTAFIAHHRAAAFGDYGLGDRRIDAWRPSELDEYFQRYNVGWIVCWSPLSKFCIDRYPGARHVATLPRPASPGQEICRDETQWRALVTLAGPELATRAMLDGVNTYKIYRIERPHSFFLEGSGRMTSVDANRVDLSDVRADPMTGSALLSLHWQETWKTDPPIRLSPVRVPGDPVPFIRLELDRPLPKLRLYNGY